MIRYKRYAYCKDKSVLKKIYKKSFPQCEQFPFWILSCCSKNNNIQLDSILFDEQVVGMQFVVHYDEIAYLMYFAIDERYRGLGYGSQALKNLVIRNNNVLLCIEKPNANDIKVRRKSFYLRNGFYETGCFIEDTGVEYELLSSVKNYPVSENTLRKRYTEMSHHFVIKHIIKHSFEVDNINFRSSGADGNSQNGEKVVCKKLFERW